MKTVNLVSTLPLIKKFFPNTSHNFTGRICSAEFPLDLGKCETKFGRWLADEIPTTRFDDDLSQLVIVTRASEEDLHVREFAQNMIDIPLRSALDEQRLFDRMSNWMEQRRKVMAIYEESLYTLRSFNYQWPVFGSATAWGVETPEEYFDKCAGAIRGLKPYRVYVRGLHGPQDVPESYGVCKL